MHWRAKSSLNLREDLSFWSLIGFCSSNCGEDLFFIFAFQSLFDHQIVVKTFSAPFDFPSAVLFWTFAKISWVHLRYRMINDCANYINRLFSFQVKHPIAIFWFFSTFKVGHHEEIKNPKYLKNKVLDVFYLLPSCMNCISTPVWSEIHRNPIAPSKKQFCE